MFKRNPLSFLLYFVLLLASCGLHSLFEDNECKSADCKEIISRTGWLANNENIDNIPYDISINASSSLPKSVSLENKFPPIGDQKQYGTCVAWAIGYNLKTALNAIEKGWSSTDLSKSENQTSPKDLWFTIDNSKKAENCSGTSFEPALDALILKGATSLNSVPYSNMGNCSGSSAGNADNRLTNYRKIAYNNHLSGGSGSVGMTLDNFKNYLAQGRPVVVGAKLGDRFLIWNNDAVISSDTYNNPGMQHANHAMALVGYDDNRNAFRLRNSWGERWGDKGSIWVDYDFFLEKFCFVAFVAQNLSADIKEYIKETDLSQGYNLLAASAEDRLDAKGNSPRERTFTYDVYNIGTNIILASQKWSVLYLYYNAFNANDFGIIFEDHYTDEYGSQCSFGNYSKTSAIAGGVWNNMDVRSGKKVGEECFETGFHISYTTPNITGKYYLVVFADAYDVIKETNEDNNFYFITADNGKPLEYINGIMQNKPMTAKVNALAKTAGKTKPTAMAKSIREVGGGANAYTPAEIRTLVLRNKRNGVLAKKVEEYRNTEAIKKYKVEN
jgi:C1A family cysteine protease